jgi:NUDIX domain
MQVRSDSIMLYVARLDDSGVSHEFLQLHQAGKTPGEWQNVWGQIAAGEVAWHTALRSLMERTGLAPARFFRVDGSASFYTPANDTLWQCPRFFALVDRLTTPKLSAEHDQFRWIDRKYIETQFIWPNDRRALAEICAEILDDGPAAEFLEIPLAR